MTAFTSKVREIVAERSGGRCEVCGKLPDFRGLQLHHRLPRRMGGTRRPEVGRASNALALCAQSHDWIENRRSEALDFGLLLHAGDDPRAHPVMYRDRWAYLADDGAVSYLDDCDKEGA